MNTNAKLGMVFLIAGLIGACGGGGSSGSSGTASSTTEGLEIAKQVSLVDAQDSSSSASTSALGRAVKRLTVLNKTLDLAADSDYMLDAEQQQFYVTDQSFEFMAIVNDITCLMDQTQYASFVNAGPYLAQVDEDRCETDHSSDVSSESSVETVNLENWIVDVTRDDDSSPQEVRIWVDLSESEGTMITGILHISEGKSDANPLGIFRMDAKETDAESGEEKFSVALEVQTAADGALNLQMQASDNEDEGQFEMAINADLTINSDGSFSSGVAHLDQTMSGISDGGGEDGGFEGGSNTVDVAFDADHYHDLISKDGEEHELCMSRTEFSNNSFDYNLYDASTGALVDLNGGFPVHPQDGNSQDWCFADHWGVWCPPHISVTDGSTFTDADGASYTLFVGVNRLFQYDRGSLTLGDVVGKTFHTWDEESGNTILVEWNGSNLVQTGVETCSPDSPCMTEDTPETPITVDPDKGVNMWSEDTGNINVPPDSGTLSNDTETIVYTETKLSPSNALFANGDVNMVCYIQCPNTALTAEQWNSGDITLPDKEEVGDPYVYTINADTFAITLNGQEVGLVESISDTDNQGPNAWGYRTGAWVLEGDETALENPWDIWGTERNYSAELGPNPWNQHMELRDSDGNPVVFDDPIRCIYDDPDHGRAFLDYEGSRQLNGIPWVEDMDDETDYDHFRPLYSLDDGTELDCGDHGTLITRAMVVEQTMNKVDPSTCSGLDFGTLAGTDITFADVSDVGDTPDVTDEPKVVAGVIQ